MIQENQPNASQDPSSRGRFHIGMRNIKTGLSVLLCLIIYQLIGRDGTLLASTSAIICLQDSVEKTLRSGRNRLLGTAFGALVGMVLLYLNLFIPATDLTILLVPLGTVFFIWFCNIIRNPDAIVIGCVVLLAITLQQTDQSPFLYSIDRLIDTFVGIFIAIIINQFVRNPERHGHGETAPVSTGNAADDDEEAPRDTVAPSETDHSDNNK